MQVEHHAHQREVTLAPWAITQLRAGGFGILPQPVTDTGLLPNRRLSLWPYTNVNSRHIQWGNRFIFVQANMKQDKIKLGWPNPAGWLGYWLAGTLFVKKATFSADGDYYDFGSSSECYCDPRFLELETLGPRVSLEPAEKVDHKETWTLYTDVTLSAEEDGVAMWVDRLGIGY